MRIINRYITTLLALLMTVGCSSPLDEGAESEELSGSLLVSLDMTRSGVESSSDLLESASLKIYNSEGGLVRYYKDLSKDIIDYLAVGYYSAQVYIGESVYATYSADDISYSATCDIEIASQQTTDVSLEVTMQNTMVSIVLDETLDSHYTDYYVVVYAANSAEETTEETPQLKFTTSGDGYLIVDGDVKNLVWQFCDEDGVMAQGLIEGAEKAHQYQLTFKHTDYLDVSGMTVSVEGVETFDDILGFKPQPVIKGEGFDIVDVQNYVTGDSYQLSISSLMDIAAISATTGDKSYVLGVDSEISYDSTESILTLDCGIFDAISQGGVNTITIEAWDSSGSHGLAEMSVGITGFIGVSDEDFWNNTTTMTWYTTTPASQVNMQYRLSGDEEWCSDIIASSEDGGYTWSGTSGAEHLEWSYAQNSAGLDTWQLLKGYAPSTMYEFRAVADNTELNIVTLTSSDVEQEIATVSDSSLSCYTSSNTNAKFWASGNNSYSTTLCSYDSSLGAADLNSQTVTVLFISKFAAGNLYSGVFSMPSTSGLASFGQKYDWVARPKSLKFNYKVTVGSEDRGRVFIAIVDWSSRRTVTTDSSGNADGSWDPTTTSGVMTDGDIIGYGSVYFDDNVSSMTDYELPIYYYSTTKKPTSGNYSIVVSATASYDGEHLEGSTSSELWIKDFKFGY